MSAGFQGFKQLYRHPVSNEYLWKYGTRMFFPNVRVAVMRGKNNQESVAFKTDPKNSKFELKQFLTSVYGFNVKKINTLNYEPALGHHHAPGPKQKGKRYKKRSGFKKAYVTLSNTPVNSVIYKMKEHAEDIQAISEFHKEKAAEEETTKE